MINDNACYLAWVWANISVKYCRAWVTHVTYDDNLLIYLLNVYEVIDNEERN